MEHPTVAVVAAAGHYLRNQASIFCTTFSVFSPCFGRKNAAAEPFHAPIRNLRSSVNGWRVNPMERELPADHTGCSRDTRRSGPWRCIATGAVSEHGDRSLVLRKGLSSAAWPLPGCLHERWLGPRITAAFGATRTISFYHIHTKETLTITYKKNGEVRSRSA